MLVSILAISRVAFAWQSLSSTDFHFSPNGQVVNVTDTDDTPHYGYTDKDGEYYFQSSHSDYDRTPTRQWSFFRGLDMDTAQYDARLSTFINPENPLDSNGNTTWRCDNSPTGRNATSDPVTKNYAERNYCDLVGVWVDPDTGDWIGLVHNEFTPQPYHDAIHFDAIDYTVSKDQGQTWSIVGHAITSPYPTIREDNSSFPYATYDYGDGDPRLSVDIASGYFYVWYVSRIVDKGGTWVNWYQHVARAPLSGKMATGTWQKWYNGTWDEPGVGGMESNMVPTHWRKDGYTPPNEDYSPNRPGSAELQAADGDAPVTNHLEGMDAVYNAYLGLWIAEPQIYNQSQNLSQRFFATDDLTTQRWTYVGDSGEYKTGSWYRWMLDPASKIGPTIMGKVFRIYCSVMCSTYGTEYTTITVNSTAPAQPLKPGSYYVSAASQMLTVADGVVSSGSGGLAWSFTQTGDGSYLIHGSGGRLGVDSNGTSSRAWGTIPTVSGATGVGQEWWVIPLRHGDTNELLGGYKLVSRYNLLVLALSSNVSRLVETTPIRSWNDTGSTVGGGRSASEQELSIIAV